QSITNAFCIVYSVCAFTLNTKINLSAAMKMRLYKLLYIYSIILYGLRMTTGLVINKLLSFPALSTIFTSNRVVSFGRFQNTKSEGNSISNSPVIGILLPGGANGPI